jgi:hypothetical protein
MSNVGDQNNVCTPWRRALEYVALGDRDAIALRRISKHAPCNRGSLRQLKQRGGERWMTA